MVSSSLAHAWQFHSFIGVNPLQTTWLEHGIVSGRVALLLRSAEIQPLFGRFSDWIQNPITHTHITTRLASGCSRVASLIARCQVPSLEMLLVVASLITMSSSADVLER